MTTRDHDHWKLGAFFAAYFAAAGVFVPYFPLYLQHRGLDAAQIGIVLATAQALRVVGPNLWGWIADHTQRRTAVLRWTALAAALSFVPILLPGGFGLVLATMFAVNLFMTAQIPVAEAITAAHLRARGTSASGYGRLRAWGTIGFVVLVLACGPLFAWLGMGLQPWFALALLAATFACTCLIGEPRPEAAAHAPVSVRARLADPHVRWFFVSSALMVFAHGALYTYLSLHLARLGYGTATIGVFWVVGALAEVVFFHLQGRVFARFGVQRVLAATFVLAALRFLLIAEFAQVWLLLLVAQLLHAATFAAHHSASILTVQRWFPGYANARGQALYVSVSYGVGGTAGSLVAAWLWTAVSPAAAFLSSCAAAVAGWLAVQRTRLPGHETGAAAAQPG
jgi:PPP family 3-phenylpropionic acid transporter